MRQIVLRLANQYNQGMSDLFDKLNVLMQSRLPRRRRTSRRDRPPALGRKADRDLARLRAKIDEALAEDDRAKAEIDALNGQIANWDTQADAALAAGQDATARHAVRQMKLVEQRRTMAEADLDAHRRATADLIQQVSAFETALAEARRQRTEAKHELPSLTDRLPAFREPLRRSTSASASREPAPVDERAIEDDLARRRARLSQ